MAQTKPNLEVGQRLLVRPSVLTPHELCADLPMHSRVVRSITSSFPERGIIAELLITPDYKIADGRHRWRGVIAAGSGTQECLPVRVVAEEEVQDIIITSVAERYDLSVGAKVFMLLPMIEKAAAEGKAARTANLKTGTSPENRFNRVSGKMGLEKLAEELGCSTDMLTLARNTCRLFDRSDARRDKWLQDHLDEAERWADYEAATGSDATWTDWRAARLQEMGHDPEAAASAAIIPEDYRGIYQAKLFSVEPGESMSLGTINKAVGSALETKGQARGDMPTSSPQSLLPTLERKLTTFGRTMFHAETWAGLHLDERIGLAQKVAATVAQAPAEVRKAILEQLKKPAA